MPIEDLDELDGGWRISHPRPDGLMFDPWLELTGTIAEQTQPVIQEVLSALSPGRPPRVDLERGVTAIVLAIIANLLVLHHNKPEGYRLIFDFDHRRKTRYDRPGFRKLPEVVRALEQSGRVTRHDAVFKKLRTTVEASDALKPLLLAPQVCLSNVAKVEGEETIILTARPQVRRYGPRKAHKLLMDYQDTEETIALKAEMDEINRFLTARSITLEGSPQPAFRLVRRFTLRKPDDPIRFDLHGRLYGGFWMSLKATERHRLRIDCEPIADLDFASMFPRLAYRHVGQEAPEGDLYAVPGLEDHREGAKAALSALLSYGSDMQALPAKLKALLPGGWTASRLTKAFAAHHPDLEPLFGKDLGLDLMFTESRILLASLKRLIARDIPALPMHDGLMVPRSRTAAAKLAMHEAAEEIIGVRLPVTLKT